MKNAGMMESFRRMEEIVSKKYFTLTGTQYYMGKDMLKPGMKLILRKEPDNKYDSEAILVLLKEPELAVGHVANSIHTVAEETMSARRLYDSIGKKAKAKVVLVTDRGVICKICKNNK